ncbi:MAG: hypothetical protein HC835_20165 [Oscillatoriales cyanobacterium RM2_1_1]|nr:hypothetical protein [Oscillatoriales cyanobacterium SM2_3_0]NJO47724.1 hypothetical protein [Oscillatoriales cyanobacterium RM2_1_1]
MAPILKSPGNTHLDSTPEVSNSQIRLGTQPSSRIPNPVEVYFPLLKISQLQIDSLPIASLQTTKLAARFTYLQLNQYSM